MHCCSDLIISSITRFSCQKRQGASADELQVKAAKILPLATPYWADDVAFRERDMKN